MFKEINSGEIFKNFSNEFSNIQNYVPIYEKFIHLDEDNYNNLSLETEKTLQSIKKKINNNIFLGNINNSEEEIFIKFCSLIDCSKFMVGKFKDNKDILKLPSLKSTIDKNNLSFVDGFFSFLSCKLLHEHKLLNGLNFYGMFLANKTKMIVDIEDEIDYLTNSKYFNENSHLYNLNDNYYEEVDNHFSKKNKLKINIHDDNNNNNNNDCIPLTIENIKKYDENNELSSLRSSYTSKSSNSNEQDLDSEGSEGSEGSESDTGSEAYSISTDESEENYITAELNDIPINIICLEKCHMTLDKYMKEKVSDQEWEAILLQIIFTLITYQKAYLFVHNDLHTNNVMYVKTNKEYVYYRYNEKYYKIPTFGKIWKIIDFGRAIYRYKDELMFSDSFSKDGDASTQYNCEPYFNPEKNMILPNFSFDLCRLGCSLYDYFFPDNSINKKNQSEYSDLEQLVYKWCLDDKKRNILIKNNGEERYPEFKLYKMITRSVTQHIPKDQLKLKIFSKYIVKKNSYLKKNKNKIMNIDLIPNHFNFKNQDQK